MPTVTIIWCDRNITVFADSHKCSKDIAIDTAREKNAVWGKHGKEIFKKRVSDYMRLLNDETAVRPDRCNIPYPVPRYKAYTD